MNKFEQQKIIQVVLYILTQTGGIDFYHLFKIIYFAEQKHLAKWGCRIIKDDLCALDYGPVPTGLYDAIKGENAKGTCLADLMKAATKFAGEDAPYILLPKETADMNYLSKSEVDALDEAIKENTTLPFGVLKDKSHDIAWQEARKGDKIISPIQMAKVLNADEATLEYIKEQMELDKVLS